VEYARRLAQRGTPLTALLTLHKNTVQYRIRKAEGGLGRPVGENRHDVELALQASHWLGSAVLRPAAASTAPPAADHNHDFRQRVP